MSEADGKVRIEYEIDGIEEATTAQERLEASLSDVQQVLDRSGATLAEYESETRGAAESTDSLAAAAVESGFKLAEMRERVSSAVGALGTLSSMLGTESDAGAAVGRMAHFGQLGMQIGGIFGPEGAVVGGIAGATLPAIRDLINELEPLSPLIDTIGASARSAAAELRSLASAPALRMTTDEIAEAGDAARRARDEESVAGLQRRTEDLDASLVIMQRRITSARQSGTALGALDAMILEQERGLMESERIGVQRALLGAQQDEAEEAASRRPRGGRGGGSGRGDPRAEERFLSEARVAIMDEEEARRVAAEEREQARLRETFDVTVRGLDERHRLEEQYVREREQWESEALVNRIREEGEALERQESKRLAIKRRQQADARMWEDTGKSMLDATLGGANAIGGAFANAFGQAIQGQADFGEAFIKGSKQMLIQYGTGQVAEGVSALLSAVGMAFTNSPGAAGKAVEGAGKIALGVSLGAAGAAISTPAAPSGEDKAPRMGPAANDGAAGGNVIVNMNSPFVTAGTRAQLGRDMARTIGGASTRFGRAA